MRRLVRWSPRSWSALQKSSPTEATAPLRDNSKSQPGNHLMLRSSHGHPSTLDRLARVHMVAQPRPNTQCTMEVMALQRRPMLKTRSARPSACSIAAATTLISPGLSSAQVRRLRSETRPRRAPSEEADTHRCSLDRHLRSRHQGRCGHTGRMATRTAAPLERKTLRGSRHHHGGLGPASTSFGETTAVAVRRRVTFCSFQ